ncbi:MAG: nucleotidyltransferase [Pseudomonadota bacterium]
MQSTNFTAADFGIAPHKNPLPEARDMLLADTAIRLQLNSTNRQKAIQRYQTMQEHIEREGSPLRDLVELFYPQGSMAIGATIASKLKNDEFDVDIIIQTKFDLNVKPQQILDLLFISIRGEKGSRYFDMTERNSRCVTVQYADGMHIDFTPSVLLPNQMPRISHIFHHKPEDPDTEQKAIIANPFGFAEWFKEMTAPSAEFAQLYESLAVDYEMRILKEKAEAEELPEDDFRAKSLAVVSLQLLKRWRNVKYDEREGRQPPSVMMAKLVADASGNTTTLSKELLFQAENLLGQIAMAHDNGQLITVMNPACPTEDCFTDRWPGDLRTQGVFLKDLEDLVVKLNALVHEDLSLPQMQAIMSDLFGENPTLGVFKAFNERIGASYSADKSYTEPKSGSLNLTASGLLGAGMASEAQASTTTHKAKSNTFYGGIIEE